jgi:uncharacterized Zn-binding protein involved in type VI secretion
MGRPAAKSGDKIVATDMHVVLVPSGSGTTPTPKNLDFEGIIDGGLSRNVRIMGRAAATVTSTATNTPVHTPPEGTTFKSPPSNKGTITRGSGTVRINGKAAARHGDKAKTCSEAINPEVGSVETSGSVSIGG